MCEGFVILNTHTAHTHTLALTYSVENIPRNYHTMTLDVATALQFHSEAADYLSMGLHHAFVTLCTVYTDAL